jgi:hypothetical protein
MHAHIHICTHTHTYIPTTFRVQCLRIQIEVYVVHPDAEKQQRNDKEKRKIHADVPGTEGP